MKIVPRQPTVEMLDATGLHPDNYRHAVRLYHDMYDAAPDVTEEVVEKAAMALHELLSPGLRWEMFPDDSPTKQSMRAQALAVIDAILEGGDGA